MAIHIDAFQQFGLGFVISWQHRIIGINFGPFVIHFRWGDDPNPHEGV